MAISFTQLAADPDTSNTNSYSTPSISPTANRLLLAVVLSSRGGSADPDTPTLSGNGLTWAHVDDGVNQGNNLFESTGTLRTRLCLFFAVTGASPSSGAVTASFTNNCTGCSIIVVQSNEEVDLADPVIQVKLASGTGATSGTLSMDPFGDANNATFSCWGLNGDAGGITHEGTELADIAYATPARETQAQYLATSDTSPGITWSGANSFGGIGVEIGLAVAGDVEVLPNTGLLTLAGASPAVSLVALPAAAILSLIGNAATAAVQATPTPGVLSLSGFAPTVSVQTAPTPAVLTLVGLPPSLGSDVNVTPDVGTLTLFGFAPTTSIQAAPTPAVVTATTFAPTASVTALPGAGTLTATSFAPAVSVQSSPGQATMTLTGFAPTITDFGITEPVLTFFDQPTPAGGTDTGTPGAAAYDQPTPGTVRA